MERQSLESKSFESKSFDPIRLRPTVIDVDLDALEHNYRAIERHVAPAAVMPVVKSNAYGHGMVPCALHLEQLGAPILGVALLEEGIQLRLAGVRVPILVLGGILGSQLSYFLEYDLDILASSVFKLEAIEAQAAQMGKRARVHLEIDTGMERIGVHYYNAEALLERALSCVHCEVVGVSSHFAQQDDPQQDPTREQLARFLEAVSFYSRRGLSCPVRHIAASGAILTCPEARLDLVRPGVALYGVYASPHQRPLLDLRPIMSLHSRVVYFKVVKAGTGVSYSHRWTAPVDSRVVTVPIGYGDGYLRRLTNTGEVIIRGKRYPIAGTVCMDQFMVDLGADGEGYNGDEVVLIGEQGGERISVEDIAAKTGADVREFLVSTNLRVPRRYFRGGVEVTAEKG